MTLAYRLLLYAALLAGAFGFGWLKSSQHHEAKQIKADLASERATRVLEAQAVRNNSRISDELTKERLAGERRAADAAGRLRQLAAAAPDPAPGCPSRNEDTRPAAWVLRDEDRDDLVALGSEADAIAARLRACQALTP